MGSVLDEDYQIGGVMIKTLARYIGALVLGVPSSLLLGVLGEGLVRGQWNSMDKLEATIWGLLSLGGVVGVGYLTGFRGLLAVLASTVGVGVFTRKLG